MIQGMAWRHIDTKPFLVSMQISDRIEMMLPFKFVTLYDQTVNRIKNTNHQTF